MRLLVTGGSGLLGAELVRLASQSSYDVFSGYNTHLLSAGNRIRFDLKQLDVIPQIISEARPAIIIHTAAVSDVDLCEEKPDLANLANGEATGKVGQAASEVDAFVIYVSTDYVFDGETGSYCEEDEPKPINCYGRSKMLGEELLKESGARHCVARTSVVYGWGREHRPNFATWVLGKLKSNEPLEVVNDQFASPTLNTNLAEMLLDLASLRIEGIIHLAGATRIDRYNFSKRIAETFRCNPDLIEPVKSDQTTWKAKRPADSSLNVEKATRLLRRKPLELGEALEQFLAAQRL